MFPILACVRVKITTFLCIEHCYNVFYQGMGSRQQHQQQQQQQKVSISKCNKIQIDVFYAPQKVPHFKCFLCWQVFGCVTAIVKFDWNVCAICYFYFYYSMGKNRNKCDVDKEYLIKFNIRWHKVSIFEGIFLFKAFRWKLFALLSCCNKKGKLLNDTQNDSWGIYSNTESLLLWIIKYKYNFLSSLKRNNPLTCSFLGPFIEENFFCVCGFNNDIESMQQEKRAAPWPKGKCP